MLSNDHKDDKYERGAQAVGNQTALPWSDVSSTLRL